MASNKDSVDLSSVNKAQNTQTAKPNKVISLKNPLKKQKGPARDGEGKFTSGSGRLKQISFNWKRALPLVLVVAIAGGFMVLRSSASSNTGFSANQFSAGSSVRATPVKETTRSSKRNVTVISLANTASSTDARAVYTSTVAPGRYRACLLGVAQRGNPRGTLNLRVGTNSVGSMNYSATNTEEYKELNCFNINHQGGSSATSNAMTATVTNTRANTTLRISSILLVYEGRAESAPVPLPNPPVSIDTIRIATLGDSNTAARNWRNVLQDRLRQVRCSYDMIGQFGNETWLSPNYDWHTDAKSGSSIASHDHSMDIFRLGENTIQTHPNVIIVIAGTNNVSWGERLWNGDTMETAIGRVITNLRNELYDITAASPDSLILLGAIPHSNLAPNFVAYYNTLQSQLVEQMRRENKNIHFWNAQTGSSDIESDGVHLNNSGVTKYGNAAFSAIESYANNSGACQ